MKKINILFLWILGIVLSVSSCKDDANPYDYSDNTFVRVTEKSVSIAIGDSYTFVPYFDSDETANKKFIWNVLDPSIAEANAGNDHAGIVTGKSEGTTVVEIVSEDQTMRYFVDVVVFKPFELEYPIYIDFGPRLSGEPFNNYTGNDMKILSNLVDEKSNITEFSIEISSPFSGTLVRDLPNVLGFPREVSNDVLFSDGIKIPVSSFKISNLNKRQKYTFIFYGAINDNNTETEYRVIGKTDGSVLLNTSYNTSNVAIVENILPKDDSTIDITLQAGPNNMQWAKFFGINAMIIFPEGYELPFPKD
ncbi:Ig-like domain-containing protein [Limibacterium fermenti]|uniref:Ig-like domain-containing protein n=1 Tax=Limibacterium fermenti TaxID=3229863 RepID=UPI003A61FEC4